MSVSNKDTALDIPLDHLPPQSEFRLDIFIHKQLSLVMVTSIHQTQNTGFQCKVIHSLPPRILLGPYPHPLYTVLLLLFEGAALHGVWDLSSLTRDPTLPSAAKSRNLHCWTARNSLPNILITKWLHQSLSFPKIEGML